MSAKDLCLSCGVCCDGTLFTYVPVSEDPPEQLAAAGLRVETPDDAEPQFPLPCQAWRGGCCQVYDLRPKVCREFRCRLLRKYEQEKISWSDATEIVRRAQRLRDHIRDAWATLEPDTASIGVAAIQRQVPSHDDLKADRALMLRWAPVLMPLAKMRGLVQEYFSRTPPSQAGDVTG